MEAANKAAEEAFQAQLDKLEKKRKQALDKAQAEKFKEITNATIARRKAFAKAEASVVEADAEAAKARVAAERQAYREQQAADAKAHKKHLAALKLAEKERLKAQKAAEVERLAAHKAASDKKEKMIEQIEAHRTEMIEQEEARERVSGIYTHGLKSIASLALTGISIQPIVPSLGSRQRAAGGRCHRWGPCREAEQWMAWWLARRLAVSMFFVPSYLATISSLFNLLPYTTGVSDSLLLSSPLVSPILPPSRYKLSHTSLSLSIATVLHPFALDFADSQAERAITATRR